MTEPTPLSRVGLMLAGVLQEGLKRVIEGVLKGAGALVVFLARSIMKGEDAADPVFRDLTNAAVKDLTGADVSAGHGAVGQAVLHSITGGAGAPADGQIQPSTSGAEAYLEAVMKLALEGYLEGSIVSALSLNYLEKFGELDDILAQVLGLGRMSRRVIGPLLNARVITPFQWHVDKTYRPTLLGAGEVSRQVARGRMSREQATEELARQGYSDGRIEALLNAAAKFHSIADLDLLVRADEYTRGQAVQHLRDAGYDEPIADTELKLEQLKRIASFERTMAGGAIDAFARGSLDRATLDEFTQGVTIDDQERAQLRELADARRIFRRHPLSPAEAKACVRAGILAVIDYREALRNDGYDEESVLALELLLRHELDEQKSIAQHRAELETQRAIDQAAKDAAAAARKAQIEADRALARRGDESDLERAAIRGLVSFARVEELYRARYDADTVDVLVDLLEQARADYLDQVQAAADAKLRAGRRNLDVGTLERAYLDGVLTVDRLQSHPTFQQFSASDQAILLADFARRKAEQDAAAKTKADAKAAAERKGIDLGRFERLVRLGARTLAQYETTLAGLGFTAGAITDMRELLGREIQADEQARSIRADREAALRVKGLSLEQFRRAVVLGTKTDQEFHAFLEAQGFTEDARAVLLADVRATVADAESARQRRDQPSSGSAGPRLSLDRGRQAARLGLITPATYADRLRRDGFSDDDIAIEMELFLLEVGAVQTDRARRDVIERELVAKGLSLEQLARAVRVGLQPLEAYQASAIELGYEQADVAILVRVLGDELRATQAAKARRDELAGELTARSFSLAELEAGALAGTLTVAQFIAELTTAGLAPDDAELLGALLVTQLEAAGER